MGTKICGNCFLEIESDNGICPHCGYDPSSNGMYFNIALPIGTTLSGKYTVGRVLGQGGFGITYLAMDCIERKKVAIKEFFPNSITVRKKDLSVTANSPSHTNIFEDSRDRFLEEAGTLTRLISLSGVVHVLAFFQENGTAYSVMEFIDGESLKERVERKGALSWKETRALLMPVMETLIAVHRKKIIHQDIAPDNILIARDGTIKLVDFGAAKFDIGNITQDVHAVVKKGFTPIELYSYPQEAKAVSDVYSMAATFYYALTEHRPQDALSRQNNDALLPPSGYNPKVPHDIEDILMKALSMNTKERYHTMKEFYEEFGTAPFDKVQITFYNEKRKIISQKWYRKGTEIDIPQNPKSYSHKLFTYEFTKWTPKVNRTAENHADYYPQYTQKFKRSFFYTLVAVGLLILFVIGSFLLVIDDDVKNPEPSSEPPTTAETGSSPTTEPTEPTGGPTEPEPIPATDIVMRAMASSTFTGDGVSHDVYNLLDGDEETNWTEGVSGQGIGEYVEFTFDQEYTLKTISIQSGVAYRDDLFEKNSRPHIITLMLSNGSSIDHALEDTSIPQTLTFEKPVNTSSLRIIIKSVYPGSKWDETAISAISFGAFSQGVSGSEPPPPEIKAHTPIAAGTDYTLAIAKNGSVIALGQNDFKQGNTSDWKNVIDIDAGWMHSAGLLADGTVVANGANASGQCNVSGWSNITDVDVGWLHTVAVRSDGTVLAKGDNQYGQCDVYSWTDIIAVSAGFTHTVGLKADGTLVAVGKNSDGECDVSGIRSVKAIYAGVDHTVALHSDGTVTAVGGNDYGECDVSHWQNIVSIRAASSYTLGLKDDGTIVAAGSGLPKSFDPASWSEIVAIAAGQDHAVGLRRDGTLVSIGRNRFGECDTANLKNIALPGEAFTQTSVEVTAFEATKPVAISGGCGHSAILRSDGTVFIAGCNDKGQCDTSHWKDIAAVSAGEYHTLGLKHDGTVLATGDNQYGQCNVSSWNSIAAVSAGTLHSVGLRADGTVVAVGENKDGQCNVSDWRNIVAVASGYKHTVGLRTDGTVVAVGINKYGQCDVSGWTDIVAISSEGYHTVGLKSDGSVVAVGRNNYGQCNISDWSDIVDIAAEGWHTVGLRSDGSVVAVGYNEYGQCNVSGWKDVAAIAAGNDHTLGLKTDGSIYAIGENHAGQCNFTGWTALGTGSAAKAENIRTGIITGNNVNIREVKKGEKPSIYRPIIGVYKKGDHILMIKTDGDWVATEYGYVHMNWVALCQ